MSEELMPEEVQRMFSEDLIFVGPKLEGKNEWIRFLGNAVTERHMVQPSFTQAVIEREIGYPTGLSTGYLRFAVPHTDAKHVIQQAVIVAKLEQPVSFVAMGTDDEEIPVEYIFMLLLKNDGAQVPLLQKLMDMCSDRDITMQLKQAHTAKSVLDVINGYYGVLK